MFPLCQAAGFAMNSKLKFDYIFMKTILGYPSIGNCAMQLTKEVVLEVNSVIQHQVSGSSLTKPSLESHLNGAY